MDDDKKETPPLTLVADNSSVSVERQRAQRELEFVEGRASDAVRKLTINLLRIIAGAGDPLALKRDLDEASAAYANYLGAARNAGSQPTPLTRALDLNCLFSTYDAEYEPTTEEGWQQWAEPRSPYVEYIQSTALTKLELRRAVLRQVAFALSTGDCQEPHLKAHGGNLDALIESILADKTRFEHQRSLPPKQPNPRHLAIAEQKIGEIRKEKRMHQLQSLPAHHITGLHAVESGSFDHTDNFTLDVLGSMNLLTRPKGSKGKSAWQLTDEGKLALEMHKQREKQ